MGKAELFSYLSAFVTVVVALAVTNILQSASLLIQARRRVQWDARPIVFAAIVFIALVSEFFSVWSNLAVTGVTMVRLLWMILIPALFAILAYSALPNEVPPEGANLAAFFEGERRLWAVLFGIIAILDLLRTIEAAYRQGVSIPVLTSWLSTFVLPIMATGFAGLLLLFRSRRRIGHWLGLLLLFGWIALGTLFSSITIAPAG